MARRVAVLISGRGSNMAALARAAAGPGYPAELVAVIADHSAAPGLTLARGLGLPAISVDRVAHIERARFEAALEAALEAVGAELVCLAGFMRILSRAFVERWADRLLNIHPSLLPAFPGLDTHARALAAGARVAGCTVHLVRPAVDSGPILAQALVPILAEDDACSLAARVLAAEHRLYPAALGLWCAGRLRLEQGRVVAADIKAEAARLQGLPHCVHEAG